MIFMKHIDNQSFNILPETPINIWLSTTKTLRSTKSTVKDVHLFSAFFDVFLSFFEPAGPIANTRWQNSATIVALVFQ